LLIRLRSGNEPIPVISTGREDSLESRMAKFLLGDLISPEQYPNLPDAIERVLDESIEQPESFSLSEFKSKLTKALEGVMQTTIEGAEKKYNIDGLLDDLADELKFTFENMSDDNFKNKVLGGGRFDTIDYDRPSNFISENDVKVKEVSWETKAASYEMKNVTYSESEFRGKSGSKPQKLRAAGIQPYKKEITSGGKFSEYIGAFTTTGVSRELAQRFLEQSKGPTAQEFKTLTRKLDVLREKVVKALEELKEKQPNFAPKLKALLDATKGIPKSFKETSPVGSSGQLRAATKVKRGNQSFTPLTGQNLGITGASDARGDYPVRSGEMTELNRGYNYLGFMIPRLKSAVKAVKEFQMYSDEKFTEFKQGDYIQAMEQINSIENKLERMYNISAKTIMEEMPTIEVKNPKTGEPEMVAIETVFGELRSAEQSPISQQEMKRLFDTPHKFLNEYLPEDLRLYKVSFSIRKKMQEATEDGEKTEIILYSIHKGSSSDKPAESIGIDDKITATIDLRPAGFKPGEDDIFVPLSDDELDESGKPKKINPEGEAGGTVRDRERLLLSFNEVTSNVEDLERVVG